MGANFREALSHVENNRLLSSPAACHRTCIISLAISARRRIPRDFPRRTESTEIFENCENSCPHVGRWTPVSPYQPSHGRAGSRFTTNDAPENKILRESMKIPALRASVVCDTRLFAAMCRNLQGTQTIDAILAPACERPHRAASPLPMRSSARCGLSNRGRTRFERRASSPRTSHLQRPVSRVIVPLRRRRFKAGGFVGIACRERRHLHVQELRATRTLRELRASKPPRTVSAWQEIAISRRTRPG